jgi:hypothetical protein
MNCPRCDFKNLEDSKYCERCGHSIKENTNQGRLQETEDKKHSLYKEIEKEIEDVIFKPKKKRRNFLFLIIIIGIGALLFLLFSAYLVWLRGTYTATGNTGDGNYTNEEEAGDYNQNAVILSDLIIEEPGWEWSNSELYFKGTLINNTSRVVKDVKVRLDLYKDKAMTKLFDTRYINIIGAPANGAFTFSEQVYAYPEGTFWGSWRIEGASN